MQHWKHDFLHSRPEEVLGLLEHRKDVTIDWWAVVYALTERDYLPPVLIARRLAKPENPTRKHLIALRAMLEALKLVTYRTATQKKRLQELQTELRQAVEAS